MLAIAGCGGDGTTEPRTATRLDVLSGANQTGPVGEMLGGTIVVRASDAEGPLSGVAITVASSGTGSGSASPATVTTGATGEAQVTWTLGSAIGTQTLTFSTTGVSPVSVTATGTAGTPSLIFPVSDGFQFTVVNRAVSIVPRVKVTDVFGNPSQGVAVTFEAEGGGSVAGATPTTGPDGTASVGSWTIGPDAVNYTLRARMTGGTVATFQAQGIPATFTVAAGNGQTANVGTAVPTAPAVRAGRDDGTPMAGVSVTFSVTGGGGMVQGTPVQTGIDGIARPIRWVLGTVPGANAAEARIVGKDPVNFQATGVQGAAASAIAASPVDQSAFFGNFVRSTPAVRVTDASGNPVAGIAVTFEITQGDGQVTGATQITGFDGRAQLNAWRLGNAATHQVRAASPAFPPVLFNASAAVAPASTFPIDVRFVTTAPNLVPTEAQRAAFDQAVARWREIILTGDAPYPVNESASFCFPAMNETVPGVVIFAKLQPIDNAGGILGQAGPCIVRDDPGYLSAVGHMLFDTADLASLEASGRLNAVILHEMGHVLGFGTMWDFLTNALLVGRGTGDPVFNGSSARGAFLASAAIGTTFTGTPVPVENTGGGGTRDSHWREATVSNELMTGFLNQGVNPLSAFTAASFRDLGYVVNDAVTETFTFQAALQAMLGGPALQLREAPMTEAILVIDKRGRVVRRLVPQ